MNIWIVIIAIGIIAGTLSGTGIAGFMLNRWFKGKKRQRKQISAVPDTGPTVPTI